jgi:hypothetical protein
MASVFSLPTPLPGDTSLGSTEPEYSVSPTEMPSAGNEPDTTEDADKPVVPDNDDMETAEVIVFKPLFRYQRVEAERRRKLKEARRQYAYYPYYPYRQ